MREFWRFNERSSDDCALAIPGGTGLTYGKLARRADAWAEQLKQLTANRRCLVALELDLDPESIAAYLGALRAGYPAIILEPGQISSESGIFASWRPEISIPAGAVCPVLNHLPDEGDAEPHPDLRVLLSTSGSTGDPKLVRLSARNIASNANAIAEYLGITPADRAATTLPLHYSYGLSVLNSYLAAEASLLLVRQSVIDPVFWNEARAARVTSLALVPHQFELLAHGGFTGTELPSLRYMTQAGGKLAPDLVSRFDAMSRLNDWELFIMYGQTEAAPRISFVPPEALPAAADTIGRAIPGGRLWLAAEDGTEIKTPGHPGELVYAGPNVMMGYAITRADLERGQDVTDLHTGDVAERTDAGYFRIVGRHKRFVKLYGLRISLDQIEAFLLDRGIPVQAVALEDRLVILHRERDQGMAAVAALADEYSLPPSVIHAGFLAEVPRLSSGKPDHGALRSIATEMLTASLIASQQAHADDTLAKVLQRATRSPKVGPEDSFNSLGGDSLSYLQMQLFLEERLGQAPQGWEDMPLVMLEGLSREVGAGVSDRVRLGIDVPLRLLAITLVVVQHATNYPLYGGTWMLIALMGFVMARFQLRQISLGEPFRLAARLLYPIVPLYFLLLAAYELVGKSVPLSFLLLLGNYRVPTGGWVLGVYWFVSVYTQLVLAMALVSAVPVLREAVVRRPWAAPALAVAAVLPVLAVMLIGEDRLPLPYSPSRGFLECLSVFLIGWMLHCWQGRGQLAITGVLATIVLGLLMQIDAPWHFQWSARVLLVLTFVLLAINPKISLPTPLARQLTSLASVTLFVYLLHQIVVYFVVYFHPTFSQPIGAGISVIVSFLVAILASNAFKAIEQWSMKIFIPSSRVRLSGMSGSDPQHSSS